MAPHECTGISEITSWKLQEESAETVGSRWALPGHTGQKLLELLLISARYNLCCQVLRLWSALSYCGNLLLSPRTTHGTRAGLLPSGTKQGWHCSPLSALCWYNSHGQNENHNITLKQTHPHVPLGFTNTTLFTFPWKTICKLVTLLSSFEETCFDTFEHWIGPVPLSQATFFFTKFRLTTSLGLFHVIAQSAYIFLVCFTS